MALISTATPDSLHFNRRLIDRATIEMKNGNAWVVHWRQFIVDVCIGAAALVVAFAATGTLGDVPPTLSIAVALVGIALILEPDVTVQPATDDGRQSLQLRTRSETAWPIELIGPAIADAASVG